MPLLLINTSLQKLGVNESFRQIEQHLSARCHHFSPEIGEAHSRVNALPHRYASRLDESLHVCANVFLEHLLKQSVSRELIEMMFSHLSRTRSTKHRGDSPFAKPPVESCNAAQYLSHDDSLGWIQTAPGERLRFGDGRRLIEGAIQLSSLSQLCAKLSTGRRVIDYQPVDFSSRWEL